MDALRILSPFRRSLLGALPDKTLRALVKAGRVTGSSRGLPAGFYRVLVDRATFDLPAYERLLDAFPAGVTDLWSRPGKWTEYPGRASAVLGEEVLLYAHPIHYVPGREWLFGCRRPHWSKMVAWGETQKLPLVLADWRELLGFAAELRATGIPRDRHYVAAGSYRDDGGNVPTLVYRDQNLLGRSPGLFLGERGLDQPMASGAYCLYAVPGGEAALRAYLASNP